MEYSKENTMTRKEYLKSKKKNKIDFSKLKYPLLLIVIILLSIYVFKQLNVYNNVTKMANKVMEESALVKTMTMYYVQDSYTKEETTAVMLYKSSDESRTKIENSENLENITVLNSKLYGIKENNLYCIDLENKAIEKVIDASVNKYIVTSDTIYYYIESKKDTGIYKYELNSKESKKIIDGTIHGMQIQGSNIYVIAQDKTSKSILRYNLDGKDKKLLSDTYIVNHMKVSGDTVYFVNSKDGKLYSVSKDAKNLKKIIDSKIYVTDKESILIYDTSVIYINKDDENTLHMFDLKTGMDKQIVKKSITSVNQDANVMYYTIKNSIGIYKYDLLTGKTTQVTSARTDEYICKN